MLFRPDSFGSFADDRERRLALKDRHRRDVQIVAILATAQVLTQTPWQLVWAVLRGWLG